MTEQKFVEGVYFNKPHPKAPDFVLGSVNFKKDIAIAWLQKQVADANGYVKTDAKESKGGKIYMQINDYQKTTQSKPKEEVIEYPEEEMVSEQSPF